MGHILLQEEKEERISFKLFGKAAIPFYARNKWPHDSKASPISQIESDSKADDRQQPSANS